MENLVAYKASLAKKLFGENSNEAKKIIENDLAKNIDLAKRFSKFDKKQQEIIEEIIFADLSWYFFHMLEYEISFDRQAPAFLSRINSFLEEWNRELEGYRKILAENSVKKGFFLDSVFEGIECFMAASLNINVLKLKLSKPKEKKDSFELREALDSFCYYQSRLLRNIEAFCKLETIKSSDYENYLEKMRTEIDKVQIQDDDPEFVHLECINSFEQFLEKASKESLDKLGLVNFLDKWLRGFERVFEETKDSKEAIIENFAKVRMRLSALKKLFDDEVSIKKIEELERLEEKEILKEIIQNFNDMLDQLQNIDKENPEFIEKSYELIEGQIKKVKEKFDSIIKTETMVSKDNSMFWAIGFEDVSEKEQKPDGNLSNNALDVQETISGVDIDCGTSKNLLQHKAMLDDACDAGKEGDLLDSTRESSSFPTENQNIVTNQKTPSLGVTNSEAVKLVSINNENAKKPWFRRFVDWIGEYISSGLSKSLNNFLDRFLSKSQKNFTTESEIAQNKEETFSKVKTRDQDTISVKPLNQSLTIGKVQSNSKTL